LVGRRREERERRSALAADVDAHNSAEDRGTVPFAQFSQFSDKRR
jgi:hypothetical protein